MQCCENICGKGSCNRIGSSRSLICVFVRVRVAAKWLTSTSLAEQLGLKGLQRKV